MMEPTVEDFWRLGMGTGWRFCLEFLELEQELFVFVEHLLVRFYLLL